MAIAFDVDTGKMHQHGSPKRIHSWATMTRRRLRAAGAQDMAHNIVASGRQRLEALNKCLGIQDYCRRMLQRLATLPHGKLQRTAEPFQRAA